MGSTERHRDAIVSLAVSAADSGARVAEEDESTWFSFDADDSAARAGSDERLELLSDLE